MAIINPNTLSWNGKEALSLSEAVLEKVYSKPQLNDLHTFFPGIKAKQQIPYFGLLGAVGRKHTNGTCKPQTSDAKIAASQKYWLPGTINDRLTECWENLMQTLFVWGLKNGVKKGDLNDTDFANMLMDRLGDAMWEGVLRHAWFGDTNAAALDDSPAGVLTAGTDPKLFNAIDGFWDQIFAIGTADPNRKHTININSGSTYAAQSFDASGADSVIDILESLVYNADYRLRGAENKMIICTQSIADAYTKYLRSQALDQSFIRIENGTPVLYFDGIQLMPQSFMDRVIDEFYNTGAKWTQSPHRAVLTTKENLGLGFESEDTLTEMETIYDPVEKNYHIDFQFLMDAKVVEDYMIQAAY